MHHETAPLYPSATLTWNSGNCYTDIQCYDETEDVVHENNPLKDYSPSPTPAPTQTLGQPLHLLLGPENTVTTCPFCHASIKTAVKYTTTTRTHITALLYYLMCCLCCIGYCSDSAKNSDHYCPNCQRYLGTYVK